MGGIPKSVKGHGYNVKRGTPGFRGIAAEAKSIPVPGIAMRMLGIVVIW
jgi:hypothetical protein